MSSESSTGVTAKPGILRPSEHRSRSLALLDREVQRTEALPEGHTACDQKLRLSERKKGNLCLCDSAIHGFARLWPASGSFIRSLFFQTTVVVALPWLGRPPRVAKNCANCSQLSYKYLYHVLSMLHEFLDFGHLPRA